MKQVLSFLFLCFVLCNGHKSSSIFLKDKTSNKWDKTSNRLDRAITMKVTPSVLTKKGWVELQFEGVQNPHKDDHIGVFSPSDVNIEQTSPIKFKRASESKGYYNTGSGSLRFELLNLRADYVFVFLRNLSNHIVASAKSNVVTFTNYDVPQYGHLSLTRNPTEMKLVWSSRNATNPRVKFGAVSGTYIREIQADTKTYTRDDLCGGEAKGVGWRDPGLIHSAVMDKLQPGQKYFYIYGDEQTGGWSSEFYFNAAPVSQPSQGVSLIAYGDMGKAEADGSEEHWEEYPSLNTTKNVISKMGKFDLVLHIGDISYAVGYSSQWDTFFDQIQPIASVVPYMTCIGNHERDFPDSGSFYNGTDSGGECGIPYEAHLPMPTPAKDQPWYSFNYGNIHFILMSTEHDFRKGSIQNSWLQTDLASVDRTKTPWIIFSGHRPMYIDSTNQDGDAADQPVATLLRQHLEPYLLKYKVDLALWGHHHSYQRTCPVYQEACTANATVHVVIGMAGMGLSQNLEKVPPVWNVYRDDQEYGYTEIKTTEKTLEMKYYCNAGDLRDQFTLSK